MRRTCTELPGAGGALSADAISGVSGSAPKSSGCSELGEIDRASFNILRVHGELGHGVALDLVHFARLMDLLHGVVPLALGVFLGLVGFL